MDRMCVRPIADRPSRAFPSTGIIAIMSFDTEGAGAEAQPKFGLNKDGRRIICRI